MYRERNAYNPPHLKKYINVLISFISPDTLNNTSPDICSLSIWQNIYNREEGIIEHNIKFILFTSC